MCVLVLLCRAIPDYPVVAAANRDEDPSRGGEPPCRRPDGVVAPRDPKSGGTWIGVNAHGVFSAVTNRQGETDSAQQTLSRGTLPIEALKEKTAFDAHRRSERIPTFQFQPFNWIYADSKEAFVHEHGGPSDLSIRLRPGLHVFTNAHGLNEVDRAALVAFLAFTSENPGIETVIAKLKLLMASHDPLLAADHRICKHDGIPSTVSSSIIALHEKSPALGRWLYNEGPPCSGKWSDMSSLLV
jgi:uncharacterized protein with NRDE domain